VPVSSGQVPLRWNSSQSSKLPGTAIKIIWECFFLDLKLLSRPHLQCFLFFVSQSFLNFLRHANSEDLSKKKIPGEGLQNKFEVVLQR
jgi:hypothetical protein